MDKKNSSDELVEKGQPEPIFDDIDLLNVRHIKLANGEDILGVIKASDSQLLLVKYATKVVRVQQKDGSVTLLLMKWMAFSDDELTLINMGNVISYSKVSPKIVEFFKSGIEKMLSKDFDEPFEDDEWVDYSSSTYIN